MDSIEQASKFILCVLRTQLGKTFTAINRIQTDIDQDEEFGRSIHIVFTMNTLLNNKQFAKRLETIEESYGKGSICVFSSKYDGKYKHVKSRAELQGLCFDERTCPRVIVMCSNSYRYEDGVEFLKVLNANKTNIARAFAYYDELHEYIHKSKFLRNQIEEIHELDIIKGILALTATPDKIWKKDSDGFWGKLQLIYLADFNDTDYAGHRDMIFTCIDDFFPTPYNRFTASVDAETIKFIDHVLTLHPTILKNTSRVFLPAHIRRSSHEAVRTLVFERMPSAVVVVLNGVEKTLQYKDEESVTNTISISSTTEEVCETIANVIKKHSLTLRPLVITGFLCVGMGQTLTHKSMGSFTHAIIGHMDLTNDEIYQLFGRITGRMKKWDTYCQTQVYCPTTIMHRCYAMEECSRKMAMDHNGKAVTRDDYREPLSTTLSFAGADALDNIRPDKEPVEPRVKKSEEFTGGIEFFKYLNDGFAESDLYIETIMKDVKDAFKEDELTTKHYFGKRVMKDKPDTTFWKCSLFGEKSARQSLENLKKTKSHIEKAPTSWFGGKDGKAKREKGHAIHLYYAYEDITNKDTLWYGVRWLKKNHS